LRAEILQAQKMRMQTHAAKIVFLGGLITYALKEKDFLALLVGPFAAFVFDCMAYGLTYNIQEVGAYICDRLEPALPQPLAPGPFSYWETAKRGHGRLDWGRAFARVGNYAVTLLAALVSFVQAWSHVPLWVAWSLVVGLAGLYSVLIRFELRSRDLSRGSAPS
jgi:hypothetical protein